MVDHMEDEKNQEQMRADFEKKMGDGPLKIEMEGLEEMVDKFGDMVENVGETMGDVADGMGDMMENMGRDEEEMGRDMEEEKMWRDEGNEEAPASDPVDLSNEESAATTDTK